MTRTLKTGEVFICSFPFTSGGFSKPRPVLLLIDFGQDCLICRITSAAYSGPLEITLNQWRQAGLLKASTARLGRLVTTEKRLLQKRIGR
jgi:mRNA interferase MazF